MEPTTPPVTDAPAPPMAEADLNALIDAELGLPPQEAPKAEEPAADENPTPDAPAEEPAPKPDEGEPASPADPASPEPAADEEPAPAEETPKPAEPATPSNDDLFIEVEDAEGVTHKISTWDDLPDDFEAKNNKEAMRIVAEMNKLETKRETREADNAKAAEEALVAENIAKQHKAWDNEIASLAKDSRIDTKDTERIDKVFAYMNEVNMIRRNNGNQNLLVSFEDALDKYEVKEAKDAAEVAKSKGTQAAKAKAGLIGRSSAAAGDTYVYHAGSAKSMDDIPV